jgi:hypothetical protein
LASPANIYKKNISTNLFGRFLKRGSIGLEVEGRRGLG